MINRIENHGTKCPITNANLIIKDKKLQINRFYKYNINGDEYMVRKSPGGKIHVYDVIDETDRSDLSGAKEQLESIKKVEMIE